jgi:hypothetical protein
MPPAATQTRFAVAAQVVANRRVDRSCSCRLPTLAVCGKQRIHDSTASGFPLVFVAQAEVQVNRE